jgi:hypothetical protein
MMHRLTIHGHPGDNYSRFAIFSVRDANLIEIENQFGSTALYMFVQIPNCSLKEPFRHFETLLFL